ncbi:hypothetical protein [Arthrobacter sp. NicSoilB4]|nr:hypothetical protein [Arthrobacter sp. NicSoilB4]
MPAQRKYPDELRERATRMAIDARKDPAILKQASAFLAAELDRPSVDQG